MRVSDFMVYGFRLSGCFFRLKAAHFEHQCPPLQGVASTRQNRSNIVGGVGRTVSAVVIVLVAEVAAGKRSSSTVAVAAAAVA